MGDDVSSCQTAGGALPAAPTTRSVHILIDSAGRILRMHRRIAARLFGTTPGKLAGKRLDQLFTGASTSALADELQKAMTGRDARRMTVETAGFLDQPRRCVRLEFASARSVLRSRGLVGLRVLDEDQRRDELAAFSLQAQRTASENTWEALGQLCELLGGAADGARPVISIATGPRRRRIVAPSTTACFRRSLRVHDVFDPERSICAATAAEGRALVCADTLTDRRWPSYSWLSVVHGVRSIWSEPITDSDGRPIGAISLFRPAPGSPGTNERQLLRESARAASLAMASRLSVVRSWAPPLTSATKQTAGHNVERLRQTLVRHRRCGQRLAVLLLSLRSPALFRDVVLGYARQELVNFVSDRGCWTALGQQTFAVCVPVQLPDATEALAEALRKRFTCGILAGGERISTEAQVAGLTAPDEGSCISQVFSLLYRRLR